MLRGIAADRACIADLWTRNRASHIREIARLIELEAGHDVFDWHVRLTHTQLT
jgi:hypothetical protein